MQEQTEYPPSSKLLSVTLSVVFLVGMAIGLKVYINSDNDAINKCNTLVLDNFKPKFKDGVCLLYNEHYTIEVSTIKSNNEKQVH